MYVLLLIIYSINRVIELYFEEYTLERNPPSNTVNTTVRLIPVNDQPVIIGAGRANITLNDYLPMETKNGGYYPTDLLPVSDVSIYLPVSLLAATLIICT